MNVPGVIVIGRIDCQACDGSGIVMAGPGRVDGIICLCAVEVKWDGKTTWICDHDGMAIGRYSARGGVDVHGTFQQQIDSVHCIDCRPGVTGIEGWAAFVAGMLKHHQVAVPAEAMPR